LNGANDASDSSPNALFRDMGGMRNTNSDVCTRGIAASIYSVASDAEQGGDIYYLSVCSSDILTRSVIADVRGHGAAVAQIGQWVYSALDDSMDTLDGSIILERLNQLGRVNT
jgi:serine phosphatase RsbU (regulator of sigma subunit)